MEFPIITALIDWEKINRKKVAATGKNNNRIIIYLIISSICILFRYDACSQPRIRINQTSIYDQNVFRTYRERSDWINQTSLSVSQDVKVKSGTFQFDYTGYLVSFYNYQDRLFHIHDLGCESHYPVLSNLRFNSGIVFEQKINKSAYEVYNFKNLLAFLNLRFTQWQTNPVETGYQYRKRRYQNLEELSYYEHSGYLRIKHFFPTRTTFIGELHYASRQYTNDIEIEDIDVSIIRDPRPGRRSGQGRERGYLGTKRVYADTTLITYNVETPGSKLWTLNLLFAQSISPSLGLSIAFIKNFLPSDDSRYLTGQVYGYNENDELYDDPYSYKSSEWEVTLTRKFPWNVQAKLYFIYEDKTFSYPLYQGNSDTTIILHDHRKDKQSYIGISVNKKINIHRFVQNLSFTVSCYYYNNQSNDPYFDFKGHAINGGLNLNL